MRTHVHLTPEIFEAYRRGELSTMQLYRLVGESAYACAGCNEILQDWRRPHHRTFEGRPTLADVFQLITHPTIKERKAAKRDFTTLLKFSTEQRVSKIRRATKRYRSPVLAELLLEACLERLPVDAQDAYHLADLSQRVLSQCPGSAQVDDLRVLSMAHLAIASKAQGHLEVAEKRFRAARQFLARLPAPHPHVHADLARMEGSYRKDRRQLRESEQLLQKAISLYELLGDSLQSVRSRLVLGLTQFYAGDVTQAVATTNAALDALNSKTQPRLFLMGRYNVTLFLVDSEQPEAAAIRLKADQMLYREASSNWPNVDLYFNWLAGRVQRSLGDYDHAEAHLLHARRGFSERGTCYDVIMVCLDLALVYATQKRHEELLDLADLMLSGFAAQGLHDESLAAVTLAARAARERRLTKDVVRKISHFLQFSRHDPALKWANVRDLGP